MRMCQKFPATLAALLLGFILLAAASPVIFGQVSAGYQLQHVSITPVSGEPAVSTSYAARVSVEFASGPSGECPRGFTATLGFWSVRGKQEVPVVLRVDKSTSTPGTVDLNWTGQADEFTVYGNQSPVDIIDPGNILLTEANVCEAIAVMNVAPGLFFFNVTPTSP